MIKRNTALIGFLSVLYLNAAASADALARGERRGGGYVESVSGVNCTLVVDSAGIFTLQYSRGIGVNSTWYMLSGMILFMIVVDRLQVYCEESVKHDSCLTVFVQRVNAELMVSTQLLESSS